VEFARTLTGMAAIAVLSAYGGTQANGGAGADDPPASPEAGRTPAELTPEDAEEQAEVELPPRGNVVVEVGEEVPIAAEGDTATATMTIDAVEVDAPCDPAYGTVETPENGHFVRLDIRAATAPVTGPPTGVSDPTISDSSFSFIGPDGVTFNGSLGTYAAFACLPDERQLPSQLGPGQQFAGSVLLDVPAPTGTLIMSDHFGSSGWVWAF
jgi:hypothetical protein